MQDIFIPTKCLRSLQCSGKQILVSRRDIARLLMYRWHISDNGYAQAYISGKRVLMHRFIMKPSSDKEVDHINHNKLDNRRSNLRVCSASENHWNTRCHRTNRLGVKGVYPMGPHFQARIRVHGKKFCIGTYKTIEEASQAYDRAALHYFKTFSFLNRKVVNHQTNET